MMCGIGYAARVISPKNKCDHMISKLVILCTECGQWYVLDEPKLRRNIARFGHSAVVHGNKMYIFGGFNGVVLGDMFVYEPGENVLLNHK